MLSLKAAGMCAGLLVPFAVAARLEGAPPEAAKPAAPMIDPDTMAALGKMGDELRSHNNFEVKADVSMEDVLKSGQKLQYVGTVQIQARRPDRFKISVVSDLRDRQIYYDGKQVTIFSPRLGYYASFGAPGTIAETLKRARENFGVELPLADLFTWGTDPSETAKIKSAFLVRQEHVDGRLCNHYALRQDRVDWQIWIQDAPALPCKIVITNTSDASMPQYTSVLRWSFPAAMPDNLFAFAPPSGAQKIVMATLGISEGKKKP